MLFYLTVINYYYLVFNMDVNEYIFSRSPIHCYLYKPEADAMFGLGLALLAFVLFYYLTSRPMTVFIIYIITIYFARK